MVDALNYPIVRVPGLQKLGTPPMVTQIMQDAELVTELNSAFEDVLLEEARLREIVSALQHSGLTFGVLGGWVRDQLLTRRSNNSSGFPPNDIDLVVLDTTHAMLEKVLPPPTTRTIFGGFTYSSERLSVDLWGAKDTYLTRHFKLPTDLPHVLSVTDFNINAIVFSPGQSELAPSLLDGGAIDSLARKTIAFHFEYIALPIAQVARLLAFSIRLGLSFDDGVKRFMRQYGADDESRVAVRNNLQERHPNSLVHAAMDILDSVLHGVST